jgi:glucose/mannose-6-phosphate isomerase
MLDELEQIKEFDKSMMLGVIRDLPEQIKEIVTQVKESEIPAPELPKPNKILVLGMGGSAISGDILSSWLEFESNIIISTVRYYEVPKSADENTLVFACSYSGNTEETLSAVNDAFEKKCNLICITSGGKLKEFCKENDIPMVNIPGGLAPRAAIAYLFFPIVVILEKLKIIDASSKIEELISVLREFRKTLVPEIPVEKNQAKKLAMDLSLGVPYIYSHTYLNVIADRWKTQLNENAKVLAMTGQMPEMNHNEIVGWAGDDQKIASRFIVVLLRSEDEHPRIKKRFELSKKMLQAIALNVIEIEAVGENKLTRMFTTMYLGDFTSVYLALLRGLDPTPVMPIDRLKQLMED